MQVRCGGAECGAAVSSAVRGAVSSAVRGAGGSVSGVSRWRGEGCGGAGKVNSLLLARGRS